MDNQKQHTLATYVGDMHAFETHLLAAFEQQQSLAEGHPEAKRVVQQLVDTSRRHMDQLAKHVETFGQPTESVTDKIKAAGAGALGVVAGLIDAIRPQSLSKALRDSYTATNHAIISYIMLQTAATALDDQQTASVAGQFLADVSKNAQAIASVMPSLVIHDLKDDVSLSVTDGAADRVTNNSSLSYLYGGNGSSGSALSGSPMGTTTSSGY